MQRPEPAVHWEEGMLIRPHHFQALARHLDFRFAQGVSGSGPAWWGASFLNVDENALKVHQLSLEQAELVLKDGTALRIPETARVRPRSFEKVYRERDGVLDVLLGVPLRVFGESIVCSERHPDRRFFVEEREDVRDENTGESPQTLHTRRLNARIFFSGESTEGYETLRIGRIGRRSPTDPEPVLLRDDVPPCVHLRASSKLHELVSEVRDAVLATNAGLAGDLASRPESSAMRAGGDAYLKLLVTNQYAGVLSQLCHVEGIHPFHVYSTLVALAGALATFTRERVCGPIDRYDHDDMGPAFSRLCRLIRDYLEYVYSTSYEVAEFQPRPGNPRRLEVEFPKKWLDGQWTLYLAAAFMESAPRSAEEIYELFRYPEDGERGQTSIKLVADVEETRVLNTVIRGLMVSPLVQTPGTLPPPENMHYFLIDQAATRLERWAALKGASKICLGWLREPEPGLRFLIYAGQGRK